MAYTPVHEEWHDDPATDTPITAAALEHIEAGIVAAAQTADAAQPAGDYATTTALQVVQGSIPTTAADVGAATSAQGALADTAVQPADLAPYALTTEIPTAPEDVGAQPAGSYATAAQGSLADTAVQPDDLATVATTGAYGDLSGVPTDHVTSSSISQVVAITQTAYDALPTPRDDSILYVVTG